jgi:hypothetical protein
MPSSHPAQLASEKALTRVHEDLLTVIPRLILPPMYLKILSQQSNVQWWEHEDIAIPC